MNQVSPNPSDRELVQAVIAGKLAADKAAELLRGNDQTVKAVILEALSKQKLQVPAAVILMARLDAILAAARPTGGALRCKVSEKGAVSVYGLQRMPVTLYVEQWERLLGFADELKGFCQAQNGQLSRKPRDANGRTIPATAPAAPVAA